MFKGIHRNFAQERVIFGSAAADAVADEMKLLGKSRAFIVSSPTVGGIGGFAASIARGLGNRCSGLYAGVSPHAPRNRIVEGANAARAAQADLLIAVGGGSTIDAGKAMLGALWADIATPEKMDVLRDAAPIDPSRRPPDMEKAIRMIAVPTTFSAAEFTFVAGVTDTVRGIKESFVHPLYIPQSVILDPTATLDAPLGMLLATGMKAIDHAVEGYCSPLAGPAVEATASKALGLLMRALPAIKAHPADLDARAEAQLAMWLAISCVAEGVRFGASHALGHVLGGSYGIPHGITSCVTLPAVLRWNATVNHDRQKALSALTGNPGIEAYDLIDALISRLELPGKLREVGIDHSALGAIAEKAMGDFGIEGNPRKIGGASDLAAILELAW